MVEDASNAPSVSRRTVLKATSAGAIGTMGLVAATGTAAAHCPCDTCVEVGKVEDEDIDELSVGDTFTFWYEGDDIVIEVTNIEREQGEPVCVDIKTRPDLQDTDIGHALCRVNVKGGPDTEVYDCQSGDSGKFAYDENCVSSATGLCAPEHFNPNRTYFGLSHFTIYVCDFNGDGSGLGGTCSP